MRRSPLAISLALVVLTTLTIIQAQSLTDWPHVAGDYMGEHWLATYALLALLAAG